MDAVFDSAFDPASPVPSRGATPMPGATSSSSPAPASSRLSTSTLRPKEENSVDLGSDAEGSATGAAEAPVGGASGTGAAEGTLAAGLEKEVGEVVNQLSNWGNSLWGGFRKQSAQAYDLVKKDISRTVKEAQEDMQRIQKQTVEVGVKDPMASVDGGDSKPLLDKGKGKATDADEDPTVAAAAATSMGGMPSISSLPSAKAAQDLFAKFQSSVSNVHLPASLPSLPAGMNLASVQKSLTDTLASNPHLKGMQDITALRNSLTENIQKNLANSGVTLKQAEKIAEEYLKKSEILLSEAGDFLKDAVKIVPPEESGGDSGGVSWDGSDMYAFTTIPSASMASQPSTVLFDASTAAGKKSSSETVRLSRTDALLRRLRSDKELFQLDPSSENETQSRRDAFAKFVREEIEAKGGLEGDVLTEMIWNELGPQGSDVEALKKTRDELVPSQLTKEIFWSRYFFHKHMIQSEEERRQKLLQATQTAAKDEDDDFSWDAEDEEPKSPETLRPTSVEPSSTKTSPPLDKPAAPAAAAAAAPATPAPTAAAAHAKVVTANTSTNTSPRESEESYDVVSDQPEVAGAGKGAKEEKKADEDEDEDSDWE